MGEVLGGNHLAGNRQDSGGLSGATTEEAGVQEATAADWLRSSKAGEASVYSMVVVVVVNNVRWGDRRSGAHSIADAAATTGKKQKWKQ